MEILWFVIGLVVGGVIGYLIMKMSAKSVAGTDGSRLETLIGEKSKLAGQVEQLQSDIEGYQNKINQLEKESDAFIKQNSEYETTIKHLKENIDKQEENLEELQKKFTMQFENMANRIFEEKTKKFTDQNKQNLGELLKPFKERIQSFEEVVRENQKETTKERTSLAEHIKHLTELNNKMLEDAENLTRALKGDNKAQGNWGEFILERILEESGLREGQEYFTQYTDKNEQGSLVRPDVVIKLPEEKHIVIDSKVSLVAYEAFSSAEDDAKREKALKEHIISIKAHIKQLSEKNYQAALGLDSPEFVLLFIPIESSFSMTIQADKDIYQYAWERKVVIVSPSTLLATLRTIASVWKQERQTKNAIEIARQAGGLYDKFVGFLEDMSDIKKRLVQSQESFDAAMNKLQTGRGNLISRTEKLRKLGAKASKNLPEEFNVEEDINEIESDDE